METIQLIHITPEELKNSILEGVRTQLEIFKEEFTPKEPDELLTRKEARELLKIDMSTLHKWKSEGKLKAYYIGNKVYFKRSEIQNSLRSI